MPPLGQTQESRLSPLLRRCASLPVPTWIAARMRGTRVGACRQRASVLRQVAYQLLNTLPMGAPGFFPHFPDGLIDVNSLDNLSGPSKFPRLLFRARHLLLEYFT